MSQTESDVVNLVGALMGTDEEYQQLVSDLHQYSLGEDGGRCHELVVECGSGPEQMTVGRCLASLALLYPYRDAGVTPAADRFVRAPLDAGGIESHMNATIADLYEHCDPERLSLATAAATNYLAELACAVAGRVGTSVSVLGLLDAAKADAEVGSLLNWTAPDGELGEIEKAADVAGADMIARLRSMPGEFGRLLRCGSAVNKDQLRQAIVNIGVKPGLMDGELMPEPIDTSFVRGLRGVEDFYICAVGSRKALTTNYKQVKTSGYLSRKLVLLVANHVIDPNLEDCGTGHGVRAVVQNEDHAKRLVGRYISTLAKDWWHLSDEAEMLSLIGQEISLRSPITCAGEHGICHKCYGELARANSAIHAGIYGVLVISEQITQRLLSSKHLLKAKPMPIAWPDEMRDHFSVERAAILAESSVDKIYVKADDIEIDEDEERQTTSVFYYKIAGKHGRTKVTTPVPIYLDEDAWESTENDDGEVSITPVQESAVFHVPFANSDLSEALHSIFSLIEREEVTSYHDAYAKLLDSLHRSELRTPSVHAEIILRAMVRSASDPMARPDFSEGPDEPLYTVLKLTPAILNSPSVTNSLAFERVKAQLTSTEILRKTTPGVLDALFGG
jgi:hypothetical protein